MAGSLILLPEDGLRRASRTRSLVLGIAARLGGVAFVLWSAATITFLAVRAVPGDPAEAIVGGPGSQASEEALDAARREHGLDLPLWRQYLLAMGRLATGDLGRSYALRDDVAALIGEQLGGTIALAAAALALGWLIALALARWAAADGPGSRSIGTLLEVAAAAVPHFWLGSTLILLFSTTLGWLPPISVPGPVGLVLPAVTLAIPLAGFLGQLMREGLLDAMSAPFTTSARARGEGEAGVFWRHGLRHAALPAVGLTGWAFGSLVSGAVVVETVFARPGVGRLLVSAVQGRDVPLVVGVVLVVALGYVVVTVATDVLERVLDPRLRSAR
jgi:peptide/nickel transport system permease protein